MHTTILDETTYACDRCRAEQHEPHDLYPDGWVHTMDGRDLCGRCKS